MIKDRRVIFCLVTLAMVVGIHGIAQDKRAPGLADVNVETDGILIQPMDEYASFTLTVSGPDGLFKRAFGAGEAIGIELFDLNGEMLADGTYNYELVANPMEQLGAPSEDDGREGDGATSKRLLSIDPEDFVQSGTFSILDGEFVLPGIQEGIYKDGEQTRNGNTNTTTGSGSDETKPTGSSGETYQVVDADAGTRDQVILDDLIVDGSACIGFDCVNGESFGFDTIRLKENNLRIKFMDTSGGAFPSTDWQLTANASAAGGANKFSIDDISASRTPFTVEGNAPTNALYVDDGGRVGLGTSIPVAELHVVSGDSPTLRLEQNGSSGFAPQTWDLAGNETSFFVRDASNGSTLPFRIRPGAASQSLVIDENSDIGIGVLSADASLEVTRTDGSAQILVDENSGTNENRTLLALENNGGSTIEFNDSSDATNNWTFNADSTGFGISRDGSGGQEIQLRKDGRFQFRAAGNLWLEVSAAGLATFADDITVNGVVVMSDRDMKEEFEVVDTNDVLEKLTEIPITTWKYKKDEGDMRHIGPMAQDFHAAFGLGTNDKRIFTIDSDGVALAAIQGLNNKVEEKQEKIDRLEKENQELEDRVANLESMFNSLMEKVKNQ